MAQPSEFELCAVQAASSVLCCGPAFDPQLLADEAPVYQWLDALLGSHDEKVRERERGRAVVTCVVSQTGACGRIEEGRRGE